MIAPKRFRFFSFFDVFCVIFIYAAFFVLTKNYFVFVFHVHLCYFLYFYLVQKYLKAPKKIHSCEGNIP